MVCEASHAAEPLSMEDNRDRFERAGGRLCSGRSCRLAPRLEGEDGYPAENRSQRARLRAVWPPRPSAGGSRRRVPASGPTSLPDDACLLT